jgi:hypothetical protein
VLEHVPAGSFFVGAANETKEGDASCTWRKDKNIVQADSDCLLCRAMSCSARDRQNAARDSCFRGLTKAAAKSVSSCSLRSFPVSEESDVGFRFLVAGPDGGAGWLEMRPGASCGTAKLTERLRSSLLTPIGISQA